MTTMEAMFGEAFEFNQDLSAWDTRSLENMDLMFLNTPNFNQDLNTWNTSSVTTMHSLFVRATAVLHTTSARP